MSDNSDEIDKAFQAGLVALVFRARAVGINRARFVELCGHAFDMGEKHAPTLKNWLDLGNEVWNAVQQEAKRQRGGT